jgi:hypothetical protein
MDPASSLGLEGVVGVQSYWKNFREHMCRSTRKLAFSMLYKPFAVIL